ncbi:hypothetical protein [uncultured Campylobacter sp.]|uniref:hypothetical protein n=1 Tax=uncultured Campylobacter sp. TaxID=218934 RepID=UPI00260F9FD3|nr:hypothetical protein [uncultured Campylobacter sp.]
MSERNLQILGWAGTCLSVIMYVSYVPNIMANLDGNKVPFLQPLATANFPGIIFELLTAITAL